MDGIGLRQDKARQGWRSLGTGYYFHYYYDSAR